MSGAQPSVAPFTGDADEWNRFVARQRGWTHFHLYEWRSVIERVFGHPCSYLAARDADGALEGLLPLVRVKSSVFGHFLVSMPFVNYGGPLGTPDAVRSLVECGAAQAAAENVDLLELRSRVPLDVSLPVSHRKLTVLVDLPAGDPEALWNGLNTKMRTKIRRPRKEGVTVRFGHDELDAFYDVFARHMRDLGTPTQSRRFFQVLAETFGDSVWFGGAYWRGRAIAGGCGFRWGDEFEITWSSSLREFTHLRANGLLHWSFMERAAAEGLSVYNFGRSTPEGGTHGFKRQWGGRDESLWWYHRSRGSTHSTPSPNDGRFSLGPRVWKRLPVAIATRLGPRIVRFIP